MHALYESNLRSSPHREGETPVANSVSECYRSLLVLRSLFRESGLKAETRSNQEETQRDDMEKILGCRKPSNWISLRRLRDVESQGMMALLDSRGAKHSQLWSRSKGKGLDPVNEPRNIAPLGVRPATSKTGADWQAPWPRTTSGLQLCRTAPKEWKLCDIQD